jgi:hypothetical protein
MEVENSPRAISNQLSAKEEVSPETNIIETGLGMDDVNDVDDVHESSVSDYERADNLSMITQTQNAVQQ